MRCEHMARAYPRCEHLARAYLRCEHLAHVYGWYCIVERLCPLHRGVLKCIVFGASVHNRTVQYFADHIGILITYRDWRIMAAR